MGENRARFPTGATPTVMERTVKSDESVSYTLLCAVAEAEGRRPTDLPPIDKTLDLDALDTLFSSGTDSPLQFEGSLVFEYSDSSVTVWSGRSIIVSVGA